MLYILLKNFSEAFTFQFLVHLNFSNLTIWYEMKKTRTSIEKGEYSVTMQS